MPKSVFKLWFVFIAVSVWCFSCNSNIMYSNYQTLPNQWHKDSVMQFQFKAPDTLNPYNLYVNLRNNNDYPYNNLYVLVTLNYPNGKATIDTLEYKMAAPNGALLGSGFSSVKENKLWYKGYDSIFKFTEKGNYTIGIQHAMRAQGNVKGITYLQGVTDVGFSIEKIKE